MPLLPVAPSSLPSSSSVVAASAGALASTAVAAATTTSAGGLLSGALEKARLVAFNNPDERVPLPLLSVTFFLNPSSIRIRRSARLSQTPTEGHTEEVRWQGAHPMKLELGELWFDTYERKKSVHLEYIHRLERLLDYVGDTHHAPCVTLLWGAFTGCTHGPHPAFFYVSDLDVEYTMFRASGMPVRAKVRLGLTEALPISEQQARVPKESPDHAKLHTVRRGDTLQSLAAEAYGDPRQWRRIADTNDLDDPLRLAPGTRLLIPPILR